MSTAILPAPTTALPIFATRKTKRPEQKPQSSAPPPGSFEETFLRCKKQAHGGFLLFRMGEYFVAYKEDAEILADTLGILPDGRGPKDSQKSVTMTAKHIRRNIALLRANGHMDIWICDTIKDTSPCDASPCDDLGAEIEIPRNLLRN